MDKEKQQYDKMVNTPIKKLVLKLAIPTIISMLVTSIYNLADTLFVSSLGESVSGAISIVFPIMTIYIRNGCRFTYFSKIRKGRK